VPIFITQYIDFNFMMTVVCFDSAEEMLIYECFPRIPSFKPLSNYQVELNTEHHAYFPFIMLEWCIWFSLLWKRGRWEIYPLTQWHWQLTG